MVFNPFAYFTPIKSKTVAQYMYSTPDNDTLQSAEAPNITTVFIKTGQHMERKKHDQQGLGKKECPSTHH